MRPPKPAAGFGAFEEVWQDWLGAEAAVCATRIEEEPPPLEPAEEPLVRNAVRARRAEFATGRWCARQAMKRLGFPPQAILAGPLRQPLWPAGLTGSITHHGGICAAAVVPISRLEAVGIDLIGVIEAPQSAEVVAKVHEEIRCAEIAAPDGVHPLALLFSAKESVIKAISTQAGRYVDFTEIPVSLSAGEFKSQFESLKVRGWWRTNRGFIMTAAALLD